MDAIADYGPTELFNEIGAECLLPTEFGTHCIHIDTTNFRVTGEYESEFRLRRELARSGDIVTGQTKKQTKQPILKWVFFRDRRVREFSVVNGNRQMTKIANMTDELQKSSSCLDQCMKIIILKKKICGMWA